MKAYARKKIHDLRKKLGVNLTQFNSWLAQTYESRLAKIDSERANEIMEDMQAEFGEREAASGPEVDSASQAEPERPPEVVPEPEQKREIERRPALAAPKIVFFLTDFRSAFKMQPFIYDFLRRFESPRVFYQFGFEPQTKDKDRVRGALFEDFFLNSKLMSPLFKGGVCQFDEVDLMITTNPHDKRNRLIPAKRRIGIQTNRNFNPHHIAKAISGIDVYFVWGKEFKDRLKMAGIKGKNIKSIGSVWLSYLRFRANGMKPYTKAKARAIYIKREVSKDPKNLGGEKRKSAALFVPDPDLIPQRTYWMTTAAIDAVTQAGYEPHIIRWNEGQAWKPKNVRVVRDCLGKYSRNWIPSIAVAANGMPCEEASALKIPIVRATHGKPLKSSDIQNAQVEKIPVEWTAPLASDRLMETVREYAGILHKDSLE